jgi:hypothetical protein
MLGVFREDARTRSEFLELIKHRSSVPTASYSAIDACACISE